MGSNNWINYQSKVAKLHEHISNSRKDYHFKVAHHLCDQAGIIFAEDLNLKGLASGMLAKHCLDAGWGQFLLLTQALVSSRSLYPISLTASVKPIIRVRDRMVDSE